MRNENAQYLKTDVDTLKIIRTEFLFTPLLIFLPLVVSGLLIYDWIYRDFLLNELELGGELMLGVIILFFNVVFDVSFLESLISNIRKK